ncbi:L-ascorbate oxidase [Linum grandiflorum]
MQRSAGLNGMIVVSPRIGPVEPFSYDHDRSMLLTDWYHASTFEQAAGLSSVPFVFVGEPQSLLINGRGKYNCSQVAPAANGSTSVCNPTNPSCNPFTLTVVPGKTYRIRIGSLTSLSTLSFQIEVSQNSKIQNHSNQLLNTQNKVNGKFKWALNNLSLTLPTTPYLVAFKRNLKGVFDQNPPPDKVDMSNYDIYSVAENVNTTLSSRIYRLEFNSTVDVVLQNANTMTPNNSEAHPWHLHGHDFWVLGYGEGKYDPTRDKERYNLVDPVMKNTVPLHPYGWTAIRFRANNPGVWFFHCHIESHFFMGMAVVFEEGSWMVGRLPSSVMGCGKTKPVDPANSP